MEENATTTEWRRVGRPPKDGSCGPMASAVAGLRCLEDHLGMLEGKDAEEVLHAMVAEGTPDEEDIDTLVNGMACDDDVPPYLAKRHRRLLAVVERLREDGRGA